MQKSIVLLLIAVSLWSGEYYYMNNGEKVELTPLDRGPDTHSSSQERLRFKDRNGQNLTITDEIIVKFKETKNLEEYLNRYDLKVVKKFNFGPMYLLKAKSAASAMSVANALCEMHDVEFAQPNIARHRSLR